MKTTFLKINLLTILLFVSSCQKSETTVGEYDSVDSADSSVVNDDISSVASLQEKDRKFIKNASVEMEVEDVYTTTVTIEKLARDLQGYTISSQLINTTESEETFALSDEKSMLVRKYRSGNSMTVKVPTQHLVEFLLKVNDSKVFLNSRIINAEDVTNQIKYAESESKRIKNHASDFKLLKTNKDKVELNNDNNREANLQDLYSLNTKDQINLSNVEIFLKEPNIHIAQIPVINTKNIENQYKISFLYDIKNSFIEGFYYFQMLIIGLVKIWPLVLILIAILFYIKNKKQKTQPSN